MRCKGHLVLITYHTTIADLPYGLLDLLELLCEVPETRFGRYLIRCEYSHAVEGRIPVPLRRNPPPYDLVLLQLKTRYQFTLTAPHWITYIPLGPHGSKRTRACARVGNWACATRRPLNSEPMQKWQMLLLRVQLKNLWTWCASVWMNVSL